MVSKIHSHPLYLFLVWLVVLCHSTSQIACRAADADASKPFATINGRTIELKPIGATLEVPQTWVRWMEKYRNSIHLKPEELSAVRLAHGEWDKEYAQVVNAVLPFDRCLAHAGSEGWGSQSVSYQDVQLRIYVVDLTPKVIAERLSQVGRRTASRFSNKVSFETLDAKGWDRVRLSYDLWYSDYGATANVDIFASARGKQTVALVFMYCESVNKPADEVLGIVKSFNWKD